MLIIKAEKWEQQVLDKLVDNIHVCVERDGAISNQTDEK